MAEPIIKTDKATGEGTEITLEEFSNAIKGLMNTDDAITEVCQRRRPIQTSFAIYTLNAEWLVEGHSLNEIPDLVM